MQHSQPVYSSSFWPALTTGILDQSARSPVLESNQHELPSICSSGAAGLHPCAHRVCLRGPAITRQPFSQALSTGPEPFEAAPCVWVRSRSGPDGLGLRSPGLLARSVALANQGIWFPGRPWRLCLSIIARIVAFPGRCFRTSNSTAPVTARPRGRRRHSRTTESASIARHNSGLLPCC